MYHHDWFRSQVPTVALTVALTIPTAIWLAAVHGNGELPAGGIGVALVLVFAECLAWRRMEHRLAVVRRRAVVVGLFSVAAAVTISSALRLELTQTVHGAAAAPNGHPLPPATGPASLFEDALLGLVTVVPVVLLALLLLHRRGVLPRAGSVIVLVGIWCAAAFVAVGVNDDAARANAVLGGPCFNESPVAPPFTAQLAIPPRAQPVSTAGNVDQYRIVERPIVGQIIPGVNTPLWSYDGTVPGPTIIAREGRPVRATFVNQLPPNEDPGNIHVFGAVDPAQHPFEPSKTTVHFHGINQAHLDDGYPTDDQHKHLFGPGEEFSYLVPNNADQRPATYWYHDHSDHLTGPHVYRGLAAAYLLRGTREDQLPLPGSPSVDGPNGGYGVFDIPLIVKDFMIDPRDGKLIYDTCEHDGSWGDFVAVNGRQQPRTNVSTRKYRFRILNASNARQYEFALRVIPKGGGPVQKKAPDQAMTLIATDHGLLRNPIEVKRMFMPPSQRRELVIDFAKYPVGTRVELVNLLDVRGAKEEKLFPVVAFDVNHRVNDPSRIPAQLSLDLDPSTPQPDERPADLLKPTVKRTFEFHRRGDYFAINGEIFDKDKDDAEPQKDTVEEWTLTNPHGGWGHPVHLHLGKFRIMEVRGREPFPGELEGWHDTVWLGPDQTVVVQHQFLNFTGRYVFHCHNTEHEDHDMMRQFNVVLGQPGPGNAASPQPAPTGKVDDPHAPDHTHGEDPVVTVEQPSGKGTNKVDDGTHRGRGLGRD